MPILHSPGSATTIPAALRRAAVSWPDDEALVGDGVRLTWPELAEQMTRMSKALLASGIQPGDRIALWAPNTAEWVITALGAYAAGAVLLPINTRFKGEEAGYVLRTAGARMLFTVTDFLDMDYVHLLRDQPGFDALEEIVVLSGPVPSGTVGWPVFLDRGAGSTEAAANAREATIAPEQTSDIIFTSGTTGTPKGVMLTHGASTRTYASWSAIVGLRHRDRYLIVYPFFHCAGLKSGILACILTGAVIIPSLTFDVRAVLGQVRAERITMLPGPPALFQTILNADLTGLDTTSLRLAVTGAAVVPVDLVRAMREKLGFESVVTGYGLTETTGTITMCRHDDDPEVIATTSGRPIPGMEIVLVDRAGQAVSTGTPGEVLARGFAVMRGYFDAPEATTAALTPDGWLRTGDVGVLDDAGNLRITDRIKDMFIVGGFNAYPAEIENMLLKHPAIAQAAVVGAPDERLGEVGFAFIVPRRAAALTSIEVMAWSRTVMANFKVPRYVELLDALPLNSSGKVAKPELRDRARAAVRTADTRKPGSEQCGTR
jgi:acyl-CoA synthetase (AMP-forming)/AMP-acid ligase II